MALQKPRVWLQSTCHRIRTTACSNLTVLKAASRQLTRAMALKRSRSVFKLPFSKKYGQKTDRERSNQLLSLPSPRQVGEKEHSLVFIMSVPIWGRRLRQGIPARSIPLGFFQPASSAPQHLSPPLPPFSRQSHRACRSPRAL